MCPTRITRFAGIPIHFSLLSIFFGWIGVVLICFICISRQMYDFYRWSANRVGESVMNVIESKQKNVPDKPGVYIYYDQSGTIIYIGKAKSLKNRVRSYFRGKSQDPKTQVLVSKIADMEWIITDSEVEALLLENNLIKQHAPRYNIMLKDDKTYPYICISNETFPRIFLLAISFRMAPVITVPIQIRDISND